MVQTRASSASVESPAANTRSHGPAKFVGDVVDSPLRTRGRSVGRGTTQERALSEARSTAESQKMGSEAAAEVEAAEIARLVLAEFEAENENVGEKTEERGSSSSVGGSSSEEESDSNGSASGDETSATEDEDEDEVDLQALLAKARLAAEEKASAASISTKTAIDDENVFGELGKLEADKKAEAPLPGLAIPTLPPTLLHLNADGSAGVSREQSRPKASKGKGRATPELDTAVHERPLSRRQKEAMPRKQTASDEWAAMPRVSEDVLPQMKRDYQALVLANSLDPKRFMRGGNRAGKIPEKFAIGTIINPPRYLQQSTVEKTKEYRPGQIVRDLVGDEGAGEYAKRKYGDLQDSRQRNGRGQGWKSKKPKWK